jgi:predicted GNAT family N-acyltransferase
MKFSNDPRISDRFKIQLLDSLPADIEIKIKNLIKKGFETIDEDKYFSVPYAFVLAVEQENIVSIAKLFKRQLTYDRQIVTMGGFGSLTTDKKKRRKGLATALLKKGMEDFKRRNFDLAFLCTEINEPALIKLYSRVSFTILNKPYTYRGKSGRQYIECNGMIAPVNSEEKFQLAESILDLAWKSKKTCRQVETHHNQPCNKLHSSNATRQRTNRKRES